MAQDSRDHIGDLAAALVAPWVASLEALQEEVRDAHEYDGTSTLAAEVLGPLVLALPPFGALLPNLDYGNRFPAVNEGAPRQKPLEACTAGTRRDAFVRLALARQLERLNAHPGKHSRWRVNELIGLVFDTATDAAGAAVLAPPGPGSGRRPGHERVDYARQPAAVDFFNATLRDAISKIDAALGTRLGDVVPDPYDPSSVESIEVWSRAWSAAVALIALDWLQRKASGATRGLASGRRLVLALLSGLAQRFYVRNGPLPTSLKTLQLDLNVDTLVAQVLEYDPARWQRASKELLETVRIRMHAIDYERVHDVEYYRGRNVFQIYLATLSQVVAFAAKQISATTHTASEGPESERQQAAGDGERQPVAGGLSLSSAQQRVLERLRDASGRDGGHLAFLSTRFAPAQSEVLAAENEAAEEGFLWHGSIGFEWNGPDQPTGTLSGQALGKVDIWGSLHREPLWLDLLVLADKGGVLRALNVELEDHPDADPGDTTSQIVMRTSEASADFSDELRIALADPTRTKWGYEYSGLGVFVVALVDLNGAVN